MGFGSDPAKFDARRFGHIAQSFGPSLSALADAIGLPIDSVEPGGDIAVATHDVEIAAGTVKAGTVAAQRPGATCLRDGKPLMRFRANWYVTTDLEPACDLRETGWRVQVLGDTPLDLEIRFPVEPERYPQVSPGFTAHPAVNAIPAVCEAEPGHPHHASSWAGSSRSSPSGLPTRSIQPVDEVHHLAMAVGHAERRLQRHHLADARHREQHHHRRAGIRRECPARRGWR